MNNNQRNTVIAILISISLILLAITGINRSQIQNTQKGTYEISSNVVIKDEKQTIHVISKMGGYSPQTIYAQANIPTTLIMDSQNSYGCERAFRIPSLNVSEILPTEGKTPFDLGSPSEDILGTCSMGMYTFLIKFL